MNKISDFIQIHEKRLPSTLIDLIENEFFESSDWKKTTTIVKTGNVRVCQGIAMSDNSVIGDSKLKREIDDSLFAFFSQVVAEYTEKFNCPHMGFDTGYELLRYTPGGKYDFHCDEGVGIRRTLSVISCLSSKQNYEGGELEFLCGPKLKLDRGDVVLFPSNFVYKHRVCPVESGIRYSIVTWFFLG